MKRMLPFLACCSVSMGYELHEWGTFTTVSGSDGVLLPGLQREEEPLPFFVHSHLGLESGQPQNYITMRKLADTYGQLWRNDPGDMRFTVNKGIRRPVAGVTVKMETPVIYFHSDKGFRAKVDVGFNGGTISQWYPSRSGGDSLPLPKIPADPKLNPVSPEDWRIDFSKGYQGRITWDVDVLSPAESKDAIIFKPNDTVNWMRARVPEANALRVGHQHEGYLFYRGIGNFTPGLETKVDVTETLSLTNQTGNDIPFLLVFERRSGVTRWHAIDAGLKASASTEVPREHLKPAAASIRMEAADETDGQHWLPDDQFKPALYRTMKEGLLKTGLLASEADAMIQTWWNSYFNTEGLRVFWILPKEKTESILPLAVEPPPSSTVRVIVGRSEVLRPSQEQQWLAEASKPADESNWNTMTTTDRFGAAMRYRIEALAEKRKTSAIQKNNDSNNSR